MRLFLDTNVLFGSLSSDMFLSMAEYKPLDIHVYWSDYVMSELEEHLTERLITLHGFDQSNARDHAMHRITAMMSAFPKALTTGWRAYADVALKYVSDPDDAPILAAALESHADRLVTSNVKDFDAEQIGLVFGLRVERPGVVLEELITAHSKQVDTALRRMLSQHRRPPKTMEELSKTLSADPEYAAFSRRIASKRQEVKRGTMLGGYQPRDSRGRFARKIGGYGYDGDLADPDGWC